jgi:hypothetical protein
MNAAIPQSGGWVVLTCAIKGFICDFVSASEGMALLDVQARISFWGITLRRVGPRQSTC